MKRFVLTLPIYLTLFSLWSCNPDWKNAEFVKVSPLFSDHMVLQQNKPISVWGKATPSENLVVRFQNQEKKIKVAKDSIWRVDMEPVPAGGPYELTIFGKDTIRFTNVLVGEVWICAGQSNMQMSVGMFDRVKNYKKEIAEANYPSIRLLPVSNVGSLIPVQIPPCEIWEKCSPSTIETFSATAYFFARHLHKELNVPIGLIEVAWGGSSVEAWIPTEYIEKVEEIKPTISYADRTIENLPQIMTVYQNRKLEWEGRFQEKMAQIQKDIPNIEKLEFDDSAWKTMCVPSYWENGDLGYVDGVVWFRKTFKIDKSDFVNDKHELSLGYLLDKSKTYLNGVLVGKNDSGSLLQKYTIGPELLHPGLNTVAVQIVDYGWTGGIYGEKDEIWLRNKQGLVIDLSGDWKYKLVMNMNELPKYPRIPSNNHEPAVLFNGLINPLIPFAIRGCIWYQGESNASRPVQYRSLFPLLIESWREKWGQGDFPFLFVQLANFMERKPEPGNSDWAALREAQTMALSLPNTAMAVAIDIGDANDVHPKNKQEVGRRLALNALHIAYNKDTVFSGPLYISMNIVGDTIEISYSHVGSGLKILEENKLKGFAISGEDQVFKWANAEIVGESVYVWSNEIQNPKAVRYGWADNPECNLYNMEGLPASPFRTDSWDIK